MVIEEQRQPTEHPLDSAVPGRAAWVTRSRPRDVDSYRAAVAGVDIEAVRVGIGVGPNTVRAIQRGPITFTACRIGFPILTHTTIPDHALIIASIESAVPGSRWREYDLHAGMSLVYAPDADHTATNKVGLSFAFTTTSVDQLRERAELSGAPMTIPETGRVLQLEGDRTGAVSSIQRGMLGISDDGSVPVAMLDDLLTAMVLDLAAVNE